MARALDFETVDAAIQRADLSRFRRGGKHHFTAAAVGAAPGDVLQKICAIWKVVGPIVNLVAGLPLLPKKWKEALKTLASLLDTVCAGT